MSGSQCLHDVYAPLESVAHGLAPTSTIAFGLSAGFSPANAELRRLGLIS